MTTSPNPAGPNPATGPGPAYLAEVRDLLRVLPERDRNAALDDLRDALAGPAETDPAAALGTPAAYAEEVLRAVAPPRDPDAPEPAQATVLGMPSETRGPTDARVRARVWDPTNPEIVVPRLFGLGWTLNLGAVAVRLGMIRPDDYDDEVLSRIPSAATRTAQLAPVVVGAAGAAAVAARWRSLPSRVPVHFGLSGRADGYGPRAVAAVSPAAALALSAWAAAPTDDPEDRLVRPAIAASASVLAGAITAATLVATGGASRHGGTGRGDDSTSRAGLLIPAALPVAAAASLASLVLPVRAGLRRSWSAVR